MGRLSGTLAELGEWALVEALAAETGEGSEAVLLGPGDDTAVLRTGEVTLVTTDVLVEGRHFRRDWCTAEDVGRRAAAASLADVAAMGGRATALVVGLAAPGSLDASWALEMAAGLAAESATTGATVVGGDLVSADRVLISVTALGELTGEPVTRAGARPGDVLALVGRVGWAAAGLAVLRRGFRSPRAVVAAYCRPTPVYAAGPQAALAGATAMIDISDGLLADARHVAEASGVSIDVRSAALPIAEPIAAVGAACGVDPLTISLTGGDDHALLATFPSSTPLPEGWSAIGTVRAGSAVTVDGVAYEGPEGHEHFRDVSG